MTYCASCLSEYNGDTIMHYVNKHYFNPIASVKAEPTLTEDFGFWYHECQSNTICPTCRTNVDMLVSITEKHVRLDCPNQECKAVFFYRKVQLERTVVK